MRLHRWTPEELGTLHQLQRDGATHAQIAAALKTDLQRVKNRICWEGKGEEYKAKRRAQINERRLLRSDRPRKTGYCPSVYRSAGGFPSHGSSRPLPEMFVDAERRLTAPRDLTAMLQGDPAPGYSALDRKRQGVPA